MSLLQEAFEECTMIDRITSSDGLGGFTSVYQDGAGFMCAVVLDNSIEARRAAREGVTAIYTVTTERNINLQYHNIFRRERDGKIFRVTSDGDDRLTPKSAGLDMRQVSAEEWRLTDD
ncbi:MAG: hypothetical protein IJP92_00820 [Lachnospiraceae bacterium]|nr:hypothetical protein [Lachnospiraceae bacterium]